MSDSIAAIPMRWVGPVKIISSILNEEVLVPMATFESPLWPSTNRGAKVSREANGIHAVIIDDRMTRSVILEAPHIEMASQILETLENERQALSNVACATSRFIQFKDFHYQVVGKLLYLRFEFFTADAAGHNMVTKASDALVAWLLQKYPQLKYVSISGNYCTDKKVSAVNGILGRGKYVVADVTVSREICKHILKTSPENIVDMNVKKNLLGSTLAGSLRSANAHFANMLLAFYLATGQDAANIVEGSQGITYAAVEGEDLYFSVTLPNVIVGAVGNGKDLAFVQENLKQLGCLDHRTPGENAARLAIIAVATVLCCELSLLAAQTNPGELMRSHIIYERRAKKKGLSDEKNRD